jgi:hypothetical protein
MVVRSRQAATAYFVTFVVQITARDSPLASSFSLHSPNRAQSERLDMTTHVTNCRKGGCMRRLASGSRTEPNTGREFNANMIRRWSSPGVILVVTDLLDEESIQFHAIQQARRSGAKVLLVQVDRQDSTAIARTHHLHEAFSSNGSILASQDTAARMARYLRWSGIDCEPIVVRSLQAKEISSIASSC